MKNYSMGTYKFRTKKIKKNISGFTKQDKKKAILIIICLGLVAINIANTQRVITIKGGGLVEAKAKTDKQALPQSIREGQDIIVASPIDEVYREFTVYNAGEKEIREIAEEVNFKWIDYLVRLAMCESSLNPKATNDNGSHGLDRGIFQINNRYHWEVSDECAFDIRCSTIWTMERINAGYQAEWSCDKLIN